MSEEVKILFEPVSSGLWHIMNCLSIADELQKEGFTIGFALSQRNCEFIEKNEYKRVYPLPEREVTLDFYSKLQAWSQADYIQQCLKQELKVIEDFKPHLIISDGRYTAGISARATNIPWVSINMIYNLPQGQNVALDVIERVKKEDLQGFKEWLKAVFGVKAGISDFSFQHLSMLTSKFAKNFHPFLLQYKLPLIRNVYELLVSPSLCLLPYFPALTGITDVPDNAKYVGPLAGIKSPTLNEDEDQFSPSESYDSFSKYNLKIDPNISTIFVSFGGALDAILCKKLIGEVIEAFSNTEFQVVISTSGKDVEVEPASNIQITSYVPYSILFRLKNIIVICHGGIGILMNALAFGIPSLSIPVSIEHLGSSHRIKELGAGLWVYPHNVNRQILYGMVKNLYGNAAYKDSAKELQRAIREYNGAKAAVDVLKEFMLKEKIGS